MLIARSRMSRRYRYSPRMTPQELSAAMRTLDLSIGQLARLTGIRSDRIDKMLTGEDVPPHVQSSLFIWQAEPRAFALAREWADEHAHDVRDERSDA